MLWLNELPSMAEMDRVKQRLTAAELIELRSKLRPLIILQEWPDVAILVTSDMYLPPHERTYLYQCHRGTTRNVIVGSRGTAKTSTTCLLYPFSQAAFHRGRKAVVISATGFRGGQSIMVDAEKWLEGGWDSQNLKTRFIRAAVPKTGAAVNKAPNMWSIEYDSFSFIRSYPTKDEDGIRGARAHDLYIDECNIADKYLIEKVAEPFLNVSTDMRHGGAYAKQNRVFYVSTVDYDWRPFQERIRAARETLSAEVQALAAIERGDLETAQRIEADRPFHEFTYTQFDYTDLFIRREITTRDGRKFRVRYPDTEIPMRVLPKGLPFTTADATGRMQMYGPPIEVWPTYAVDLKAIEGGLKAGMVDQAVWLYEQRNITDTAAGDVYPNILINEACCEGATDKGDRCIMPYETLPKEWQERHAATHLDYVPPVLYACTDPCVLGVDFAPQSDFCAYVVIRLGPLAKGEFDPFTHTGKTPWSNVIWAEQYRRMPAREAADKIRYLAERYNLVWFNDVVRAEDPWAQCRAIGLDMRGGGSAIRDELAWISDDEPPAGQRVIYDPLDKDDRFHRFHTDSRALPMLDTIWPTDVLNDKMVEFTKAQMEQRFLYIGKYLDQLQRPVGVKGLQVGYDGVKILASQLRKIRQQPTKVARNFYMEGDSEKDRNKKDMFSAFLYAAKQMRAHIIRQRTLDDTPPPMGGVVTRVGPRRQTHGGRRAAGAKF